MLFALKRPSKHRNSNAEEAETEAEAEAENVADIFVVCAALTETI